MASVVKVERSEEHEISRLRELLARKTAEYDTMEGKLAFKTRLVNQLEEEQLLHSREARASTRERASLRSHLSSLQDQVDLCKSIANLKEMQESLQSTANVLSSTLSEERAAKRARLHQ